MAALITRTRTPKFTEIEVTVKLKVTEPGLTKDQACGFVFERLRYATAAHVWKVNDTVDLLDHSVTKVEAN